MNEFTFTLSNFVPTSNILFTLIRDSVKLFLQPHARTLVSINEHFITSNKQLECLIIFCLFEN